MRVLILTDTHGHLHLINKLATKHAADVVLHCGDFAFYSEERLEELPERELALRIRHSEKVAHLKNKAFGMSREAKIEVVREHHLEGEFELYLQGKVKFNVPVYCVPGNHEDGLLVQQLTSGEVKVHNLHMLTESSDVVIGEGKGRVRLVGIGGNFIHFTFFDREGTDAFYPSMRFTQWVRLLQRYGPPLTAQATKPAEAKAAKGKGKTKAKGKADTEAERSPASETSTSSSSSSSSEAPAKLLRDDDIPTWMLTHVSPGKLPSLELLGLHMKAQMWFSGHMGPYLPNHYALFTFLDDYEFAHRTHQDVGFLMQQYERLSRMWRLWYACEDVLGAPTDLSTLFASLEKYETELASFAKPDGEGESGEATSEAYAGSSAVLKLVNDIVHDHPIPNQLRAYISAAADEQEAADRARAVLFVAPHIGYDKRGKAFKPMQGFNSPNPRLIPTKEEIRLIEEGLPYLRVPFPVPDDAMAVESRAKRVPSDWVKSTMFFNLPDAYIGGYMLIDVDPETGRMDTMMIGSFPPRSIVQDEDDPWASSTKE